MICRESVLAERLRRQRLLEPVQTHEDYRELFSRLQPISPYLWFNLGKVYKLVHSLTGNRFSPENIHRKRGK